MSQSKPSVKDLDQTLEKLVRWERVALYLPKIDQNVIDAIKKDNHTEETAKIALYTKWLRMHTESTWNDVVSALEAANENTIAEDICKRYCLLSGSWHTQKSVAKIELDEKIVDNLTNLHGKYTGLVSDIVKRFTQSLQCPHFNTRELVFALRLECSFYNINDFDELKSSEELYKVILGSCTFLDCEPLQTIAKNLPEGADLQAKVDTHISSIKSFRQIAPIRCLKGQVSPLIDKSYLENTSIFILFKLQSDWEKKTMGLVDMLLRTLFPKISQKMKWYEIEPGSIRITFLVPKVDINSEVTVISNDKKVFLKLVGVFSLMIDGSPLFNENENKNYNFELAFLEAASQSGNTEAVKFLLDIGVNIEYLNDKGDSSLLLASRSGHGEVVKQLLDKKAKVNHRNKEGQTALLSATENNHLGVALILLNAKANPNLRRDDGNTPLHIACCNGYTQLAVILIEFGADPTITNAKGDKPFLSSIRGKMMEVVIIVAPRLAKSEIPPAILLACRLGYSDIISFLLEYLDPPSSRIHLHCANGDLALTAEHIVEFSEDANCTLVLGVTPLMIASSCGHNEVVECLIEAGANVNSVHKDGQSPLTYAIKGNRSLSVIECLLEAGANAFATALLEMAKAHCGISDLLLQYMALQLYNMFSSLVEKIQSELSSEIDTHKTTLQEIKKKVISEFSSIEGVANVHCLADLFSCLQPYYDFLSWKAISLLSDCLKREGYFKLVGIFEKNFEIEKFPKAAFFSQRWVRPHSSCCDLTISLHGQWGTNSLFNLRQLNSLLFQSLFGLMSHIAVSITEHGILIRYRIPKSMKLINQFKSFLSQSLTPASVLGVFEIFVDGDSVLRIDQQPSFTFEKALLRAILSSSYSEVSEEFELICKIKNIDLSFSDDSGITPLHVACFHGRYEVVKQLLKLRVPFNCFNLTGLTPLMAASTKGHLDIVV